MEPKRAFIIKNIITIIFVIIGVLCSVFMAAAASQFFYENLPMLLVILFIFAAVSAFIIQMYRKKNILKKTQDELSALYEITPGGVVKCIYEENNWKIISANEGFYSFIGYSKEELDKKFNGKATDFIYEPMIESVKLEFNKQFFKTGEFEFEVPVICADGIIKWAWMHGKYVKNVKGNNEFYCTLFDITRIKEMNQGFRIAKEKNDILKGISDLIFFEWNIRTGEITNSPNLSDVFGVPACYDNFPESLKSLNFVHEKDLHEFLLSLDKAKSGYKFTAFEYRFLDKHGEVVWYRGSMTTILDYNNVPINVFCVLTNIDAEKRKLENAEESARRDPLTKLYNKKETEILIQDYLNSSQNQAAFIMLDIDNFKGINDTLGHLYGDAALSELAYTLQSLFRNSDISGRIGGDEFVVFMTNILDTEIVKKKSKEINNALARSFKKEGKSYQISCSLGIAMYPENGKNFSDLLEKADEALYYAKNHGKNNFVFYDDTVGKETITNSEKTKLIHQQPVLLQKNFRDNIGEYILGLFNEFEDVNVAVPVLLDFVARAYKLGRIEVSVFSDDDKYYQILYEWCDEGVQTFKSLNMMIPADNWDDIKTELDENNTICYEDISERLPLCLANDDVQERGVKSLMMCYVLEKGIRKAVLCFECYSEQHHFTLEEKDAIKTISNTVSLFVLRFTEQQKLMQNTLYRKNRESMLDEMEEFVYVCDPKTYEIYYLNKAGRDNSYLVNKSFTGKKCHEYIYGMDKPCKFCTSHLLCRDKFYVWERRDPLTNHNYLMREKLIEWGGGNAMMSMSTDLTEKEQQNKALASILEVEKAFVDQNEEMPSAANPDVAMAFLLSRIGKFYSADKSYIIEMNEDGAHITMTHEWCAEGVSPVINTFRDFELEGSPLWKDVFRNSKPLLLEDIVILKNEHPEEYERIAVQGITCMYAVPFTLQGELAGFLGIDSPRDYRGDINILQSIAHLLADEIYKRRML